MLKLNFKSCFKLLLNFEEGEPGLGVPEIVVKYHVDKPGYLGTNSYGGCDCDSAKTTNNLLEPTIS